MSSYLICAISFNHATDSHRVSRDCLIETAFVDVSPIKFLLMRNQMLVTFVNFIHVKDYFAYIHVTYFWFVHIVKAFS